MTRLWVGVRSGVQIATMATQQSPLRESHFAMTRLRYATPGRQIERAMIRLWVGVLRDGDCFSRRLLRNDQSPLRYAGQADREGNDKTVGGCA